MSDNAQNIGYAMLPVTLSFDGITKDIADKLGVPLKAAATKAGTDAGSAIAAGVEQAKGKVEAATAKIAAANKKVEDSAGKVRVAEAQLSALRDKGVTDSGKLAAAEEKVAAAQRNHAAASDSAKNAAGALKNAQDNLTEATKRAAKAESDAADAAKKAASNHGLISKATATAGRSFDALSAKAKSFGKTLLTGVGLGAGMNIAGITSSLMEMGDTFAQVNKTIAFTTGASGAKLDELNASVKAIGKDSPKALTDIATALADVAKTTQLTGTPLETLTKQMIKLDTLGQGVDVGGLTQAMRAFGVPADQMSGKLDEIFKVARAAGTPIGDLIGTLQRGAPQLQQFGLSMGDSAALLGGLKQAGVDGDKAMLGLNTALKAVSKQGGDVKANFTNAIAEIKRMSDAGDQAGANAAASKLFGGKAFGPMLAAIKAGKLNIDQLNASMVDGQKGILDSGGAVVTMAGAWQMFKNNVLILLEPLVTKVFGAMQDGIKWFRGAGVDAIRNVGEQIKTAWDSEQIQNFVHKIGDTFTEVWPKVTALVSDAVTAFKELAPVVGPILLGAFQAIVDTIAAVLDVGGKLIGWIKDNKVEAGLLATALAAVFGPAVIASFAAAGPALLLMVKNLQIVKVATAAWSLVTKAAAAAQWIFNAAMSANPIGLIIAALAALAAGLVYAYKHSETFRKIVQGAWEGIKKAAAVVVDWFKSYVLPALSAVWEGIKTAIGVAWNIIKGYFSVWMTVFKAAANVVLWLWNNAVTPAWNGIKAVIGAVWNGMKVYFNAWMSVYKTIGDVVMWLWHNVIERAWDGMKIVISAAWDGIKVVFDLFASVAQSVADTVKAAWDRLVTAATAVWNGIKDAFGKVVEFVGGLGAKIGEKAAGMWDGIKNAFKAVINWIIDAWNKLEFKIPGVHVGPVQFDGFTLSVPKIARMADGGTLPQQAVIQAAMGGRGLVQWAEPETGGEAFIPMSPAKRTRSLDILAEVADRFGLGLIRKFGSGGITGGTESFGNISGPGITTSDQQSAWDAVRQQFPDAVLTSATRTVQTEGHPDFHNAGKALDISGPPELMNRIAEWIATTFPDSLELIHGGFGHNIKDGKDVGDGVGFYGAGTMSGHYDHVHWALGRPATLTKPNSTSTDAPSSSSSSSSKGMSLGEWIARSIFGDWEHGGGSAMTSGASTAVAGSTSTTAYGAPGLPNGVAVPTLSSSSSPEEVARAIIAAAKSRGYSDDQALAILATAMQESGLRPGADGGDQGIGGALGLFQQGNSYGDRSSRLDPNQAITAFFQRLDSQGGASSADIWQSIVGVQQHGGAWAGTAGDRRYLGEIQGQRAAAQKLAAGLGTTADAVTNLAGSPLAPGSAGGYVVDDKAVREAQDKADDAEKAVALAKQKLAEVEKDPKAKESAKQAARDRLAKAQREAKQAADDLATAKRGKPGKTSSGGKGGQQGLDASPAGDFAKILGGGLLESIGLDGSWLPDITNLGIVKMANAIMGLKFTPAPWMEGKEAPPPWLAGAQPMFDADGRPLALGGMAPMSATGTPAPQTVDGSSPAAGLPGIGPGGPVTYDNRTIVNSPTGDPADIENRIRRANMNKPRLAGAVPVGQ